MTYFGEFGLNLAFRTGTKIKDDVDYLSNVQAQADLNDISEVNMDKDMQPLRVQLKFGLGGEYKISEGTSIFGGLHYNLGFTNVVKGDSNYLVMDQEIISQFHKILKLIVSNLLWECYFNRINVSLCFRFHIK